MQYGEPWEVELYLAGFDSKRAMNELPPEKVVSLQQKYDSITDVSNT